METIHPHQRRPKIYYEFGLGWHTDRWYDQRIKKESVTNNN
jgi:hypothetical protein